MFYDSGTPALRDSVTPHSGTPSLRTPALRHSALRHSALRVFHQTVSNFEAQLAAHPDRAKIDYLITGLRHGFRLGFHSDKVKLRSAKANCPSANDHPEVIDKYLSDEIQAGRVFGPKRKLIVSVRS